MKHLFFGAIVILTQAVSANQPKPDENTKVISYEVIKSGSKISKAHLSQLDHGSVELNYAQGTVNVFLSEKSSCPVGLSCTMEVRGVFATLPIVEIKKNPCSHTIVAREDMRPVDGILQHVTIEDYNVPSTCKFIMAPIPRATYTTKYVDRMKGRTVTATSTFSTKVTQIRYEFPQTASEVFQFTSGVFTIGVNHSFITSGDLIIESEKVLMTVFVMEACAPGAMCKAGPPRKIEVELPILSRSIDHCGETIEAGNIAVQAVGGPVEELRIRRHIIAPRAFCEGDPAGNLEVYYRKEWPMPSRGLEATLWFSEIVAN